MKSSKYVYENRWIKVREDRFTQSGNDVLYSVIERDNSVVIIPISRDEKTLLLHQWRHPTQELSFELPMGGIDDGEAPIDAAKREMREETSIEADVLIDIGSFFPVPGLMAQKVHVFIAKVEDTALENARIDHSHCPVLNPGD